MSTDVMSPARSLAKSLARMGDGKDKILVHLDAPKAALLARLSGGSVNKVTGLPQFGFFDSITGALGGLFGGNSSSNSPGTQQLNELQTYDKPLYNTANQQLSQYNSGTLNNADQLGLNNSMSAAKAANAQYFANSGLANSSQAVNANNQVDTQGAITHQQLLNSYLTNATNEYGTLLQPYSSALSNQYAASQQAQNTLTQGIGGLFSSLFGGGGGGGGGASSGGGFLSSLGSIFGESSGSVSESAIGSVAPAP